MPTVQANEIDLYCEEHGSGEPLLLIMGWGGNAATWRPQILGLAKHYHVIAFDNRGVGRSSAPEGPYSIADMAADAAALLDALDLPQAHVFGVSMGGMIAQELVLEHPERVGSLILGCTTAGGKRAAGIEQLHDDIADFRDKHEDGRIDLEWFSDFLKRLWTDEALIKSESDLQDFVLSMIRFPPTPEGLRHQADAVANHDSHDRLGEIKHRTLVITGDEDELIDPKNSYLIAKALPNSELRIFEGLKHAFHLERPKLVNSVILDFLERGKNGNGAAPAKKRRKRSR